MKEPGSELEAPRAAVIAVGTELVADGRPDTNGAVITRMLGAAGFETAWRLSVPDDEAIIADALLVATRKFELVIVTGGLGPTLDDVTREATSRAFQLPLVQDARILESLRELYARRGRSFSEWSARQAQVPRGAEVLPNETGSAPGLLLSLPGGARLALLPGVPHEMAQMMERQVLPRLRSSGTARDRPLVTRGLKTCGLTEIEVQERVIDLFPREPAGSPTLTLLASPGAITVIVRGRDVAQMDLVFGEAHTRLGDHVFTEDLSFGLEDAVGSLLLSRSLRVATAESCTGGLLGSLLTRVPGSSRWFLQGWVTYSNESKISMLGLRPELIEAHGAVSPEVAEAMALAAKRLSGADLAVSITGIAGPDGGTPEKPVGLVYLCVATDDAARATRHMFAGDRETIRLAAAQTALRRVREEVV